MEDTSNSAIAPSSVKLLYIFLVSCESLTKMTSEFAGGWLCLGVFLQQRKQRPIQLVPLPVLELCSWTLRIDHAKRTTEIPQSPARIQVPQNIERVVKPGPHHLRRSVLVTAHLAEVDGHSLGRKFGPWMKKRRQRLPVANDFSFVVFQRPGRQRL